MWRILVTVLLLLLAAAVSDVHSYGGPEVTEAPTEAPTAAPTEAAKRYIVASSAPPTAPRPAASLRSMARRRQVK